MLELILRLRLLPRGAGGIDLLRWSGWTLERLGKVLGTTASSSWLEWLSRRRSRTRRLPLLSFYRRVSSSFYWEDSNSSA